MKPLLSSLALAGTSLVAASALAQAPALIPLQGFVTDDSGTPRDGDSTFEITIYPSATGEGALHQESQVVDIDTGYFSTEIGLTDPLDLSLFANQSELWVDVVIDGDPLEPRLALGTVPFAAYAEYAGDAQSVGGLSAEQLTFTDWDTITNIPAEIADGDDVGDIAIGAGLTDATGPVEVDFAATQARVSGTCGPDAAIAAINADGTVSCETDDAGGTYVAGLGITISDIVVSVDTTAIQRRVIGACGAGQVMSSINADGTVNCGVDLDTDTTYVAGAGLTLAGNTFAVDATAVQATVAGSCPPGQSIRVINNDGTVVCETDDDTDTNTTYTAGSGLSLVGTEFRANTSVVQSRVTGTCTAGQAIRAIAANGTVTCESVSGGGGGTDLDESAFNLMTQGLVSSTTDETIYSLFLSSSNSRGVTSGRVMIVTGGTQGRGYPTSGGSGTATISCSSTEISTFSVSGSGSRPWTYYSDVVDWSSGSCSLDVEIRASSASNPVVVREIRLVPVL